MKANYRKSFFGSALAFILGTSCCWLTSLAVWVGGATVLSSLAIFVGKYNTIIIVLACILFGIGLIQLWVHRKKRNNNESRMQSR